MPFIFTFHLHDILFVHLLDADLPWMASARGRADTQPVASVTHWLACKTLYLCHLPGEGSGVVDGWSGSGTVWNGMEQGLQRNGPLQHSIATTAHLYQILKFRAEVTQLAIVRLQLAAAKRISSIVQRNCATAGNNSQWDRRKPATG